MKPTPESIVSNFVEQILGDTATNIHTDKNFINYSGSVVLIKIQINN